MAAIIEQVASNPPHSSLSCCPRPAEPLEYNLTRLLGEGAQATLCLATNRAGDNHVVMKFFKEGRTPDSEGYVAMMKQFQNALLDRVTIGKRVVRMFDIPRPDLPLMTMEYCNGGDLRELMARYEAKEDWIPESFIWHVFTALTEALDFLHTGYGCTPGRQVWRPVVHRDIKPENILLTQNPDDPNGFPHVKLADFDLGTIYDPEDAIFGGGTTWYQPPEQRHDLEKGEQHGSTPAADVWAVGAVIHELATGRSPGDFHQESIDLGFGYDDDSWAEAGLRERYVDRIQGKNTLGLQYCVNQALEFDPAKRASASKLRANVVFGVKMHERTYGEIVPASVELDIEYGVGED